MNNKKPFGTLFASRQMQFKYDDGGKADLQLRIGVPYPVEGSDWYCPYEIDLDGHIQSRGIFGIDGIQALTLTMATVKVELEVLERLERGKIYFLDQPGFNF